MHQVSFLNLSTSLAQNGEPQIPCPCGDTTALSNLQTRHEHCKVLSTLGPLDMLGFWAFHHSLNLSHR